MEDVANPAIVDDAGFGFLDGLGTIGEGLVNRGFSFLDALAAERFPERYTNAGADDVVRDTEVDRETATDFLSPDNLVRIGLVVAAVAAVVIVLRKS